MSGKTSLTYWRAKCIKTVWRIFATYYNWAWTHNHLIHKRTFNPSAKPIKCGFTLKRAQDMTRTYTLVYTVHIYYLYQSMYSVKLGGWRIYKWYIFQELSFFEILGGSCSLGEEAASPRVTWYFFTFWPISYNRELAFHFQVFNFYKDLWKF